MGICVTRDARKHEEPDNDSPKVFLHHNLQAAQPRSKTRQKSSSKSKRSARHFREASDDFDYEVDPVYEYSMRKKGVRGIEDRYMKDDGKASDTRTTPNTSGSNFKQKHPETPLFEEDYYNDNPYYESEYNPRNKVAHKQQYESEIIKTEELVHEEHSRKPPLKQVMTERYNIK